MTHITVAWLNGRKACADQVRVFTQAFPDGAEVTRANVDLAHQKGLDALWALCHVMSKAQRQAFILFTLRQRQPHLVALFKGARLPEHAEAIASVVDWKSKQTQEVLAAADAAAWAAWAAADAAAWAAWAAADAARAAWDAARAAGQEQIAEACRILGVTP